MYYVLHNIYVLPFELQKTKFNKLEPDRTSDSVVCKLIMTKYFFKILSSYANLRWTNIRVMFAEQNTLRLTFLRFLISGSTDAGAEHVYFVR